MMNTLMILLFPFLDALPFTLPRYWLFRDRLRIPFRYVVLLQTLLSAAYSGAFYYINLGGSAAAAQWTTILRYGFMLLYLALAFLLIRDSFSKLMFTWLLFLAWQFFVLGNANFIESRFFFDFSGTHPYLVYNIARILIYFITCPFMFRFFGRTIAGALKIQDTQMWRQLWKIPLFSMLFGMLYCTVTDIYAFASWQFLVSRYLLLLGTCYVSSVSFKVLETSRARTQLEEALKYAGRDLLAQKKQFDTLAARMDETRKARHDLRQHLAVVQSYIDQDDKSGLAEYLDLYKDQLPPDVWERYCRNDAVNAVICYYAALARDSGIEFEVGMSGIDYPENCSVSDTDITVLLGNLLENAVEACKRDTAERTSIKLRIKQQDSSILLILVDNTCIAPVKFFSGGGVRRYAPVFQAARNRDWRCLCAGDCVPLSWNGAI
ncbi:sensor histidine kinase [Anaerolentibacter hominis]|uniref:sensor histidine kinase n=1 Tax=Anaerolentibacter hominis TaxID=3079009 RepID=UPI0031B8006B